MENTAAERGPMALNPATLSGESQELAEKLNSQVIGQERAIRHIIKAYVPMTVNLQREGRPLGVFLFMGPTGVGKTETVRAMAKHLLGKRDAITRIDCVEYDESHTVAKLIGAPPGYLGYNDEPLLSQKKIDQYQTKTAKLNIVLFDEIEKAHPRVFDSIMTILGDGRYTLGNGTTTDFSNSFIFLTSNLGSHAVRVAKEGKGIGFSLPDNQREDMDDRVYKMSKEAAKKKFRPEFMNRLDSLIVFRSLSRDTLRAILKKELDDLQWRIWSSPWRNFAGLSSSQQLPEGRSILFTPTVEAKEFLLDEGTSEIYGARELNRAVDRFMSFPLASLIASGQIVHGDRVKVDHLKGGKELIFEKMGKL